MKYENVKHYNNKTKSLTLITGIKDEEKQTVETKTYQYPFFVKGIFTKKALDLGEELESGDYAVSPDLLDRLTNFFVELYNNQFTEEDLLNGINQNDVIDSLVEMLFGVLQGDSKNE